MDAPDYKSVYGPAEIATDGKFVRFSVVVSPEREQYGYWSFHVEGGGEDDLRAFQLGYRSPEEVILAVLDTARTHEDIRLSWVAGTMDTYPINRTTTASTHIRAIVEERQLLDLSTFQGNDEVPVYHHDPHKRLLDRRLRSENGSSREKETDEGQPSAEMVLASSPPDSTHAPLHTPTETWLGRSSNSSPDHSSQEDQNSYWPTRMFFEQPATHAAASLATHNHDSSDSRDTVQEADPSALTYSEALRATVLSLLTVAENRNSNVSTMPEHQGDVNTTEARDCSSHVVPTTQVGRQTATNLQLRPSRPFAVTLPSHEDPARDTFLSAVEVSQETEFNQIEQDSFDNQPAPSTANETQGFRHDSSQSADHYQRGPDYSTALKVPRNASTSQSFVPEVATDPTTSELSGVGSWFDPSEPFITRVTSLSDEIPCMGCGQSEQHNFDCNINNIGPPRDLNVLQLRELSQQVKRFHNDQWRTSESYLSTPASDSLEAKIAGMAAIVRQEESFKNDKDLKDLPDEILLYMWAFKTSKNIECQIIYPNGEIADTRFDHLHDEDQVEDDKDD